MSEINVGGTAFPCQPLGAAGMPLCEAQPGMSLRAYFAAKNCAAMVSTIRTDADYQRYRDLAAEFGLESVGEWFASESVKQADALIAALENKA